MMLAVPVALRSWFMLRNDPIPALKQQLAAELLRLMQGWRTTELRARMRIDQPRISDLRRGRLDRFSLDRLVRLVHDLDHRVELSVKPNERRQRGT
jgi:predicted XRE-type DNA-binding protein